MKVQLASSLIQRLRGLLDPRQCQNGETLLLVPCASIHCLGMKRPIDVAFIDATGCVLKSQRQLRPGRLSSQHGAWACLERYASPDGWFAVGEYVEFGIKRKEDRNEDLSLLPEHQF